MANNRQLFNQYNMPSQSAGIFGIFSNRDLVAETTVSKLLQHIAYGEQDQAEAMLKLNPELLCLRGNVHDYSGRLFENATAFQVALRSHDADMWKMLEKYFNVLPNGPNEKEKQFHEEFPQVMPVAGLPYDFDLLVEMISQFADSDSAFISEALQAFREDFHACSLSERYFNAQHLLAAFAIYNANFMQWDWQQRDIFAIRVIGYLERYLPACYAQAFSQGLYKIVNHHEELQRSLAFKDEEESYFPISFDSQKGLGFDYLIFSDITSGHMPRLWQVDTDSLEKLCAIKVAEFEALKSRVEEKVENEHICRIM